MYIYGKTFLKNAKKFPPVSSFKIKEKMDFIWAKNIHELSYICNFRVYAKQ